MEKVNVPLSERAGLTTAEAAAMLGVGMRTMYNLVHRADFPKLRLGNKIVIPRQGLLHWVEKQAEGGENNWSGETANH